MTDVLSILTHRTNRLAKLWRADGGQDNYDKAKEFDLRTANVANIGELSALLTSLEPDAHSCIIRGRHKTGGGRVLRRLEQFEDQPLHTVLIEVDNFEPITAGPVLHPEGAALEYISQELPPEFQGVSFHWQLSNSAGFPGKEHLFKAHLWFWLETPVTSASLKEWARSNNIACDKAVFNEVQVHYTSAPVFEGGVADPVPVRSGLCPGVCGDEVAIDIAAVGLPARKERVRGIDLGLEDETVPFLDVIGQGRDGELHITCPFKDGHSMDSGPSETVYFPKGTGGFEQGHFKCLHASCGERQDVDFLDALGVRAADFDDLPVMVEAEPLPVFLRNKAGEILATADNVQKALHRSDVCGWQLRLDTFKDEVMMSPHGATLEWRAMGDVDYFALRLTLETRGFKPISKEMMRDAVEYVASLNTFDSAIEWLGSLKWDGVPRVEGFLTQYFSVTDSAYVRSVSRYMWSAMAGRVMAPGIKADMVPVFISKQGEGKSSALENLVPAEEFYASVNLEERDENLSRLMRGKLVLEIGEMRGFHSRAVESVKDYITRRFEQWIPKYREFAKSYPRRSIFIGTGNQIEFLVDTTGNRRWLPVNVGKVDANGIKADREQLWAEARERFAVLGIEWRDAQGLAEAVHDTHRMTDTWEECIKEWLYTPIELGGKAPVDCDYIQIPDVFVHALHMEIKNVRRADEQRAAGILREMGYKRDTKRVGGKPTKVWLKA
jgi:predicted P-loop ATPase